MSVEKHLIRQKEHNLTICFHDCVMGPIVYLLHFRDTNKYYVGHTDNYGDRIEGHFNHEHTNDGGESYIYKEGLNNKIVDVYVLEKCDTLDKAKYKEKVWIKSLTEKYGKGVLINKILYKSYID